MGLAIQTRPLAPPSIAPLLILTKQLDSRDCPCYEKSAYEWEIRGNMGKPRDVKKDVGVQHGVLFRRAKQLKDGIG